MKYLVQGIICTLKTVRQLNVERRKLHTFTEHHIGDAVEVA